MTPEEEDDGVRLCLPEFFKCSFLTNPFFYFALILSIILYSVTLYNFIFTAREAKCAQEKWPEYLMWFQNEQNIIWLWSSIVLFLIFLPTLSILMCSSHNMQIKKCISIGFVLLTLLLICMSFCIKYEMYPIAIASIVVLLFICLWMIWLCCVTKNMQSLSPIYGIASYSLLFILLLALVVIIGMNTASEPQPYVCQVSSQVPSQFQAN